MINIIEELRSDKKAHIAKKGTGFMLVKKGVDQTPVSMNMMRRLGRYLKRSRGKYFAKRS